MAAKAAAATRVSLGVCVGKAGLHAGELVYVKVGAREFSSFGYADDWLTSATRFEISPDLPLHRGHQPRKAPTKDDSRFFLALGDTEPDTWGRRVIARAHARERKNNPALKALNELDYLCAVDDFSRVGALRLRAAEGGFLHTVDDGRRATPPLFELEHMLQASHAVERSEETTEDLKYLLGKGTSLGGARPKCSVLDQDGALALGKFPSVTDQRAVVRGEVLALRLAARAGMDVASARIELVQGVPVAVIRRFDRTADGGRIPYWSGVTILQAGRNEEHAYTEIVDAMRTRCADAAADARQLWRRIAFNHLITNVDDHLQNIGFLYAGDGLWRLSPAFDLNPFPDKDRESKTWLSDETGPVTSVTDLLARARDFHLDAAQALQSLGDVVSSLKHWREVAQSAEVGMSARDLDDFAPAFEHGELEAAQAFLVR
jgi:serine/threonine-protein kinase HipA